MNINALFTLADLWADQNFDKNMLALTVAAFKLACLCRQTSAEVFLCRPAKQTTISFIGRKKKKHRHMYVQFVFTQLRLSHSMQ